MKAYLEIRGFSFEKFIVTHKGVAEEQNVIEFCDLEIKPDIGIILALKEEYTKQVIEDVLAIASREQVFC